MVSVAWNEFQLTGHIASRNSKCI